jgi:hypothetical protein
MLHPLYYKMTPIECKLHKGVDPIRKFLEHEIPVSTWQQVFGNDNIKYPSMGVICPDHWVP